VGFSAQPIVDCGTPLAGRGFLVLMTVTHAGPTASHYVDKIEILKEKTTETMDLQPESDETFTVTAVICEGKDYSPGQELTVRVRAHCTIHGWGDWSSSVTVPEFSQPALIGLAALIAALSLISFRRRGLDARLFLGRASR
jgi:desulfoferrodoxin (superoxide reductase-like protein)